MDAASFAEATNEYLLENTKFADAKAGAILSLVGLIGAALGVAAKPVLAGVRNVHLGVQIAMLVIGLVIAVGVASAIGFCLVAIVPRTHRSDSLRSFSDISARSGQAYAALVVGATPEDLVRNICLHNVVLAGIAETKFRAIGRAVRAMAVAVYGVYVFVLVYAFAAAFTEHKPPQTTNTSATICTCGANKGNAELRLVPISFDKGE